MEYVLNKWTEWKSLMIYDHHFLSKITAVKKATIAALSR